MLELINIRKIYQNTKQKVQALKEINLSFRKQEFVCIIGPSGCGKTTLLNIIGGLDSYSSGEIKINGKTTKNFKSKDWDSYRNQTIGFVFQNYNLIPQLTVYENVELALTLSGKKRKYRKEKVIATLEKVGLEKEIHKYPNQLSGGQMQRVAIARAIVNNPDIILADEPTGALDSKTARQIVSLLKVLSRNHLVIMVTHNQELANTFATRIISLLDGKVISDSNPYYYHEDTKQFKLKKSAMSLVSAIKLSFKNLLNKKLRTFLIVVAGSVGIISVTLVLTVSNSVNNYIDDIQKVTLSNQPITIRREIDYHNPYEENPNLENYPDSDIIHIVNEGVSYYSYVNNLSDQFVNYLESMDKNLYNFIDYKRELEVNIFTENKNNVQRVSNYSFTEMSSDYEFVRNQYDLLWGKMPTATNEIALLINKNNSLDASLLYELGIEYENRETFTFQEIAQKEYRIILNDTLYKELDGIYYRRSDYEAMYLDGYPLKITAILRPSKKNNISLYGIGFLYTENLTEYIINNSLASKIVQDQLKYGLSKNVRTGEPFKDEITPYSIRTKEYLYELQLVNLCVRPQISSIRIYTDNFAHRNAINDYLKEYNIERQQGDKIYYYDYMGDISREFDAFVRILTKVLVIFSCVALLVSTIMIGIITYVSVMERIKEIGILRSLGARKIDIANVFNAETGLIGLTSGLLGVILGITLIKPIVRIITEILKQNNITTFDLTQMDITKTKPFLILIIIIVSIILTLIAGAIPAILAAQKNPTIAIRSE